VVTGCGLGLLFVPLTLTALSRVGAGDSGAASSLLSTGQQVGGAIGLAVLGTAAWTVAAGRARSAGYPGLSPRLPSDVYQHALATGFGYAFLAAAGLMLAALVVAVTVIRADVRRPAPLAPQQAPAAAEPATTTPGSAAAATSGTAAGTTSRTSAALATGTAGTPAPAVAHPKHHAARPVPSPAVRPGGRLPRTTREHLAAKPGLLENAWPTVNVSNAAPAGNRNPTATSGAPVPAPRPVAGRHRAPRRALLPATRRTRRQDAAPR
jgi:hypothetical protein